MNKEPRRVRMRGHKSPRSEEEGGLFGSSCLDFFWSRLTASHTERGSCFVESRMIRCFRRTLERGLLRRGAPVRLLQLMHRPKETERERRSIHPLVTRGRPRSGRAIFPSLDFLPGVVKRNPDLQRGEREALHIAYSVLCCLLCFCCRQRCHSCLINWRRRRWWPM